MQSYLKKDKKLKEIVDKVKMLKAMEEDPKVWHLSPDVFHRLLGGGYIVCVNEDRDTVKTLLGLPVTIHYDMSEHISIG